MACTITRLCIGPIAACVRSHCVRLLDGVRVACYSLATSDVAGFAGSAAGDVAAFVTPNVKAAGDEDSELAVAVLAVPKEKVPAATLVDDGAPDGSPNLNGAAALAAPVPKSPFVVGSGRLNAR